MIKLDEPHLRLVVTEIIKNMVFHSKKCQFQNINIKNCY